jgi:hypothetical protein
MDYILANQEHLRKVKLTTPYEIITWRFSSPDIYLYVSSGNKSAVQTQTKPEFITTLQEFFPQASKFSVTLKQVEP